MGHRNTLLILIMSNSGPKSCRPSGICCTRKYCSRRRTEGGKLKNPTISIELSALFNLLSVFTQSLYTLLPFPILKRYSTRLVCFLFSSVLLHTNTQIIETSANIKKRWFDPQSEINQGYTFPPAQDKSTDSVSQEDFDDEEDSDVKEDFDDEEDSDVEEDFDDEGTYFHRKKRKKLTCLFQI